MRRGDVYLVDLEPVRGSEANKTRPAVIVSNNAANRAAERSGKGVLTVVPVTSNIARIYPFHVLLKAAECGLVSDSKAQAEQIRTISVRRFSRRLGSVPADTMSALDAALRRHLSLS